MVNKFNRIVFQILNFFKLKCSFASNRISGSFEKHGISYCCTASEVLHIMDNSIYKLKIFSPFCQMDL